MTPPAEKRAPIYAGTWFVLMLTLLLWGSAVVAIRATLPRFSPGPLALMRFLCAGATLAIFSTIRKSPIPARRDLRSLAIIGLFGVTLYHLFLNYGLVHVAAGAGSMIVNTAPVFTVILAGLLLKEKVPRAVWWGMAICLTGAALIARDNSSGHVLTVDAWLLVAAALSWSTNIVLQKPLLGRYSALVVTTWSILLGTIPLVVFLPQLLREMVVAPGWSIAILVYLGVVPVGVAYVLWAFVVSKMPVSRAAGFLYLIPVIATIVGRAWLGEAPTSMGLLGGAFIIGGVIFANRRT